MKENTWKNINQPSNDVQATSNTDMSKYSIKDHHVPAGFCCFL